MAPLGNNVANQHLLGTGGVDDLIMIQDYGVDTTAASALALQGGPKFGEPNFPVPQIPVPDIPLAPVPAVAPKSAFELHAAIWLNPANDAATAASISGHLAKGVSELGAALSDVLANGYFNTAATKTQIHECHECGIWIGPRDRAGNYGLRSSRAKRRTASSVSSGIP